MSMFERENDRRMANLKYKRKLVIFEIVYDCHWLDRLKWCDHRFFHTDVNGYAKHPDQPAIAAVSSGQVCSGLDRRRQRSLASHLPSLPVMAFFYVVPIGAIILLLIGLMLWRRQRQRERKSIHNSRVFWPSLTLATKRNCFRGSSNAYTTYEF